MMAVRVARRGLSREIRFPAEFEARIGDVFFADCRVWSHLVCDLRTAAKQLQ